MAPLASPPVTAAQRLPFFYGWIVAGIAMVSALLGAAIDHVPMSVLFKPMTEDLGWSRSTIAGAVTVGTIAAGVIAPLSGSLADRFGPRVLLSGGAAFVGAGLLALAWTTEPWQFYLAYIPARALATTLLMTVVPFTAVTNWFARLRPRVIGLVSMALPLGSALLAMLYQLALPIWGWRGIVTGMGIVLLVVLVAPGALLLRRRPEDLGLAMDGRKGEVAGIARVLGKAVAVPDPVWTLREAAGTSTLWLVAGSVALSALAIGIIGFHMVAYFTDVGIEPVQAASALVLFATVGALASVVWGFVTERVPVRVLAALLVAGAALAVLYLMGVRTPGEAWIFAVLFGITARSQSTLTTILLSQYFGRASFGAISGAIGPFQLTSLGLGPLLASALLDKYGSYEPAFSVSLVAYAIAAGLLLQARAPRHR